ncbi:MAG TPA: hypothetical protein ENG03_00830 [Thioploca sp.]|nr:hypothetical protein [Thioploca sp.]
MRDFSAVQGEPCTKNVKLIIFYFADSKIVATLSQQLFDRFLILNREHKKRPAGFVDGPNKFPQTLDILISVQS